MMRLQRLVALWEGSTPIRRGLLVGIPAVVLALAGAGIGYAAFHSGGGSNAQAHAAPATATPAGTATVLATDTPVSAGVQTPVAPPPGDSGPTTNYTRVQPRGGTGPGASQGTGMSLTASAAGINAGVYSRTVGTNGVMGNPSGAWDVIWYDFSGFDPGAGGYPGTPGANAVFAGHVDYIHVGPAVFWNLKDLTPGDRVTVNTPSGAVTYAIQWSKWGGPDEDFAPYVAKTGQESITLVTCIGGFSNGHYSNRLIVRGVRV